MSIDRPGNLDLRRLALKLLRIVARRVGNLSTNCGVSRAFRSPLIGQHLSDALHDLATLTFDLGSHGSCQRYGSSYSICVPSAKFVGFSLRKILCIYCVSINRPREDFDILHSK